MDVLLRLILEKMERLVNQRAEEQERTTRLFLSMNNFHFYNWKI